VNVELLNKVKAVITEEPRRYDQQAILCQGEELDYLQPIERPPCGTVACIAGWTAVLAGPEGIERCRIWETAKDLLGIDKLQAQKLFSEIDICTYGEDDTPEMLDRWPYAFAKAYEDAESPKERAAICVERIDHFIRTEGRE